MVAFDDMSFSDGQFLAAVCFVSASVYGCLFYIFFSSRLAFKNKTQYIVVSPSKWVEQSHNTSGEKVQKIFEN